MRTVYATIMMTIATSSKHSRLVEFLVEFLVVLGHAQEELGADSLRPLGQ